jgi:hypothetical protein
MKNLMVLVLIVGGCGYFGAKFYLHYRVSSGLDDALVMAAPIADMASSALLELPHAWLTSAIPCTSINSALLHRDSFTC